jgi:hypothetical protein
MEDCEDMPVFSNTLVKAVMYHPESPSRIRTTGCAMKKDRIRKGRKQIFPFCR